MSQFISLKNILPELFNKPFFNPFNWEINSGEIWTITGRNGSGKSYLADILCGQWNLEEGEIHYHFIDKILKARENREIIDPGKHIKKVDFNRVFSLADYRESYYQLRFNNPDEEQAPKVSQIFHADGKIPEFVHELMEQLGIQKLKDRRLIQLSSGELRKLLIAKLLLENPRMLIFDNPFTGLDTLAREHLNDIFPRLIKQGIQLMFLVPEGGVIPLGTTHIAVMEKGAVSKTCKTKDYKLSGVVNQNEDTIQVDWKMLPSRTGNGSEKMVEMKDIEIAYGKNVICKSINWEVNRGDKWALLGPNGSGKSTILSFIYADNPRSYIEGLSLFNNKRGSGETIWDIKKRIGFTSSEMHLYYRQKSTCVQVVESGLFDSVGIYYKVYGEVRQIALYMMQELKLGHLADISFLEVSSGEQRMLLFARAVIKNPELLILDEPFQGLDSQNKERCKKLVDSYCAQPGKTLIFVTHERGEIPGCVDKFFELG